MRILFNQKYFEEHVNDEIENGKFGHYIKNNSTLAVYEVRDGKVVVSTKNRNESVITKEIDGVTIHDLDILVSTAVEVKSDIVKFPYNGTLIDTGKHSIRLFTNNDADKTTTVHISESNL